MAGKKCRIEGLPKAEDGMHVTHGVPREEANVEAEKGETMITSDNSSNRKELVSIGGEKHSNGGTPLKAPINTAIFSDKLKIKDPAVLKFFNESGKKPKTFAQLSKKYNISKLNEQREDENNDKITNDSLDKSIENHTFKLSALFTMQEFHEKKGAPEEHSKHFEAFLDRMNLSYEDIFGTSGEQASQQMGEQIPMAAYGKEVSFDGLPMAKAGDVIKNQLPPYNESQAYTEVGVNRLNEYLDIYGIEKLQWPVSKTAIKAKINEAQKKAVETNPDLIFNYMTTDLDPNDDTYKSHRPNNDLQKIMDAYKSKYTPTGEDGKWSNEDLDKMLKAGDISTENVLGAYNDNMWWYRMVNSDVKDVSQAEMDKLKVELENNGIQQGDYKYLYKGDGYYEAYRIKDDGTIEQVEADPAVVDELYKWEVDHMEDTPERQRNMDFLWSNKRATRQARKNKARIPYLEPFTTVPDTQFVDQAYYNPDQAINAIQSIVSTQGTKQAMFAPQQQQMANFMAGQQFDVIGKVIGDYEDKNIAAYNGEQTINTQIANQASDRLSRAIEGHHDKNNVLKQSYANAMTAADNNIAENEIAMWQERADRLNLGATIGEQFAKDPTTGIHEFVKGKDFSPTSGTETSVADRFNELKNQMPGVEDNTIAKMALAMHSGKYEIMKDSHPQNSEQFS
jgi:hypothetical protein